MQMEEFDLSHIKESRCKQGKQFNLQEDEIKLYESVSKFDRKRLEDITRMEEFLHEDCIQFNEKFNLTNFLGSGNGGIVYEGKIKKTNRNVGIKFVISEYGKRIKTNEIKLLRKLKQKNIANLWGCFPIKDNSACMVMELGKYHDLRYFQRTILRRKRLSETFLCYIAFQILEGLNYCHSCKIAHFDLKPQNIIIDESLNMKIIDFSISYSYKDYQKDKIKLITKGTYCYMSPEVMGSQEIKVNDLNKCDIFSLGVLLYNLAFDLYPYGLKVDDDKDYDLIYQKLKEKNLEIYDQFDFSASFKDFLGKLLAIDIKKRISVNDALNHFWIQAAGKILDEKEKINNLGVFTTELMTDNIKEFNDYINLPFLN